MSSTTTRGERSKLLNLAAAVAGVASVAPDFDGYDPWGSAMGVAFTCADILYRRGETIPHEWEYRHGLGLDEPHPLYLDLDSDLLRLIGTRAIGLADLCAEYELDH